MEEPNPFADDFLSDYGSATPQTETGPQVPVDFNSSKQNTTSSGKYADLYQIDGDSLKRRLRAALLLQKVQPEGKFETDLYAPVWVTITVAVALYYSRTLPEFFLGLLRGDPPSEASHKLTPYLIVLALYSICSPVLARVLARYVFKIDSDWGVLELICIYGYSIVIWVPLALVMMVLRPFGEIAPNLFKILAVSIIAGVGVGHTVFFFFRQFKTEGEEENAGWKVLWVISVAVGLACSVILTLAFGSSMS
ncbi:LANO_0C03048g1_1 [Lachancea nothofagi CBS 11611]|uniref:LANO_0C03048g1_1 n=1 Tax=Lachancea nothofagi CBS 11611 TaxID=1266666 RepID=A0A1G4J5E0_9SACH|nr:LANO_0C03048g1_1 [Lachancea nothofagi CBS 11611]